MSTPIKKRCQIVVDEKVHRTLKTQASKLGYNLSGLVNAILTAHLKGGPSK